MYGWKLTIVCSWLLDLLAVVREYTDHYNERRPHQGLDEYIPIIPALPSEQKRQVRRRNVLGGVIHDYYHQAA